MPCALTLGNLWYLRWWIYVHALQDPVVPFYAPAPRGYTLEFATLGSCLLLTILLAILFICLDRVSERATNYAIVAIAFLVLANILNNEMMLTSMLGNRIGGSLAGFLLERGWLRVVLWVAGGVLVVIFARWPGKASAASFGISLLWPIAVLNVIDVGWAMAHAPRIDSYRNQLPARRLASNNPTRVLWLIFDELDPVLMFEHPPAGVRLHEFEYFRSISLEATNAVPPADYTLAAMPSLINGVPVWAAQPAGPRDLRLSVTPGTVTTWDRLPNVFQEARALGKNSALAGWYHPYCRIFGNALTDCFSYLWQGYAGTAAEADSYCSSAGIAGTMWLQAQREFGGAPPFRRFDGRTFSPMAQHREEIYRAEHLRGFLAVRAKALAFAADPSLGVVLVHFPIPHPLGIYDRATSQFSTSPASNYGDNLNLADDTLRRMRESLTASHLWDQTAVIVTSDHFFRRELWSRFSTWTQEMETLTANDREQSVPFLVRVPGEDRHVIYPGRFNTSISKDLLLALLRSEIASQQDAVAWLDRNRGSRQSPTIRIYGASEPAR